MVAKKDTALIQSARKSLEGLYLNLEIVQAGLIVAAQALLRQNADYDAEVARMLEYGVGDRLSVQLECLTELIEALQDEPSGPDDGIDAGKEEAPLLQ